MINAIKRSSLLNNIYILVWLIPIVVFGRDFFHMESLLEEMNSSNLRLLTMSMKQGILSSILSFAAALLPAYYVTYKKGRLAAMVEGTVFIPFFFPIISTIVSFSLIFNSSFMKDFDILYTMRAILIANVFYNAPIFVKYLSQGMKKIPRELIEAGRECGASSREIFIQIKLPLILPQLLRAFFLVFVYCFTSFGIVLSLGGLRYSTLEVEIANTLMGSLDFSRVFALGMIQFAILTVINMVIERVEEYELKGEGVEGEVSIVTRVYTVIFLLFEWLVVGCSIVFSFYNYYEGRFTLGVFKRILSGEFNRSYPVVRSILHSLGIAGGTSLLVVAFTYLLLRNYRRVTSYIIFSTFGISSAFLAINLVYMNILYDIPYAVLLIGGYFLTTVPLAYSFMYQYIKRFPEDVVEASRIDGAGPIERILYIEIPMLADVLRGTLLQIFAVIYAEFTITYTMQAGSYIPLSSVVNYSLTSNKMFLESSAMSTINILIIGGVFILSSIKKREEA